MRDILNASFLVRMFSKFYGWFEKQIDNSLVVTTVLAPSKYKESGKYSVFGMLWRKIRDLATFIFEKLKLSRLLEGSMFMHQYFWCALTCVCAPILPTSLVIALAGLTFLSVSLNYASDRRRSLAYSPVNKFIFIFMGIYVFSIVASLTMKESLFGGTVFIFFTFFAVLVQSAVTAEKQLIRLLNLMIAAGTLVSAYGVAQYVLGMTGSLAWLDSSMFSGIDMRVYSTLQNPNVLAEYLLLIIPLTVGMFFRARDFKTKLLYAGLCAVMGLCMILTFSRGGWLGLLFAAAVYLVILDKRFIILGLAGLIALYFILPDTIISRFTSIGNMADTSTAYRVYIWIGTLRMLGDYWLCGTGFGQAAFSKVYPAYALHAISAPHAHNLFLQITCDTGIMGLIIFIFILYKFFKAVLRAIKYTENKRMKYVLIGFVSAICGFLVQSMTDYTFYNYRVMLVFWIVLALGIVAARLSLEKGSAPDMGEGEISVD